MGSKLPRFQESVKIFRFLGWKPIFQKELLGILSEFLKMVYCSLVRRFIPMPIAEFIRQRRPTIKRNFVEMQAAPKT